MADQARQEEEERQQELAVAQERVEKLRLEDAERQRTLDEKRAAERAKVEEERKKKEDEERRNREAVVLKMKEEARLQQILKDKQEKERVSWFTLFLRSEM